MLFWRGGWKSLAACSGWALTWQAFETASCEMVGADIPSAIDVGSAALACDVETVLLVVFAMPCDWAGASEAGTRIAIVGDIEWVINGARGLC